MKETWKDAVERQRNMLTERLSQPLASLAEHCESVWGDRDALGQVLRDDFSSVPHGLFMCWMIRVYRFQIM